MAAVARMTAPGPDSSAPAQKTFVPIRPAFRPLLPKPAAVHASDNAPTVVIKSQQGRSRIIKKRRGDLSLPATVSPASLISKRRKSPVQEKARLRKVRAESVSPEAIPPRSHSDAEGSEHSDVSLPAAPVLRVSPTEVDIEVERFGLSPESLDAHRSLSHSPLSVSLELTATPSAVDMSTLQDLDASLWSVNPESERPLAVNELVDPLAVDAYLTTAPDENVAGIDPMDFFGPTMDIF